jgi:predicted amidohydrolase
MTPSPVGPRAALRVAVAQPLCVLDDVAANAAAHAEIVRRSGARLVVFPELSLTGYGLDVGDVDVDDQRLDPLRVACAESDAVAFVGAPAPDGCGGTNIATLAVSATGVKVVYRKVHLHPPEPQRFRPGASPAVVTLDGWRLGLAICRDTGVAEHISSTFALGIDAFVAATLFTQDEVRERDRRMSAVASSHAVWTIASTYAGDTPVMGRTSGGSGIWGPDGVAVAQADSEPGSWALADLTAARQQTSGEPTRRSAES